jgi:glycosyltransferase involved in cell wall biosynthesis
LTYFLARHTSGLFNQVWSVHPIADAAGAARYRIDIAFLAANHRVIEGKAELCRLPRLLRPLNFVISQVALYRLLVRIVRKERVDVVAAVDPFASGLLGLAVARATGRPFVLRISGNADDIYEASGALVHPRLIPWFWLQRTIGRFVIKRADLVAAINRNNLDFARNNGASGLTAIIPISANIEAVHWVEPADRSNADDLLGKWNIPVDCPLLLYFGRLIALKHPDDALRAMATVIGRRPQVSAIIAGRGAMEPELRRLAEELGVAASVHFVGPLDQPALSRLIPHCVVLSPSAGQLAVLESALGGAPIVAYDRDFQPEFLNNGVDGFIVPFRDWRAMAARAEQVIADAALFERLSGAIRAKAVDYLDPHRVRQAEWSAFGKVIAVPGLGATRLAEEPASDRKSA